MLLLVYQLLIVDHLIMLEHLPAVHNVLLSIVHDLLRLLEGDVVARLVVGLHRKGHHSRHPEVHGLVLLGLLLSWLFLLFFGFGLVLLHRSFSLNLNGLSDLLLRFLCCFFEQIGLSII